MEISGIDNLRNAEWIVGPMGRQHSKASTDHIPTNAHSGDGGDVVLVTLRNGHFLNGILEISTVHSSLNGIYGQKPVRIECVLIKMSGMGGSPLDEARL
jgi:hypothetical protein